jgi:hypothetical protein
MSDMRKFNESGGAGIILVVSMLVVLLIGSLGFGFWAFSKYQLYKNHTDTLISAAQAVTKTQTQAADTLTNNELNKNPLRVYVGPSAYGNIRVSYPKTWSSYVDDTSLSEAVIDGYFDPGTVPSINSGENPNTFALRVQLVAQAYDQVMQPYISNTQAKISSSPYSFPKEPSVVGTRLTGAIAENKTGDMVIIPLRDKTLKVWTEASQYESDFNTYILPNFDFSP